MGIVIPFPQQAAWEPWLSKRQLAQHFGYSTRWVELKMREGMPSYIHGSQRRYRLSETEAWLAERSTA